MKLFSSILALAFSFSAQAEVRPYMDEMMGYIYELKPYIASPTDFADPKNAETIQATLHNMVTLSEKIKHEDKIKKTALQVPAMSLNEQFKETAAVFRSGNKSHALWLLRSNLGNCVACHTQLPARSTHFEDHSKKKYLVNTFQEAEFLYIVRNFDKALEFYTKTIAGYPGNKITPQNIDLAVSRKIYYFTRVKRDLPGLATSLDKDLRNKKLVPATLENIKAYSKAAQALAKEEVPSLKTEKEVQTYAEKTLEKELTGSINYEDTLRNLRNLRLSGFLYEFMDKNPETKLKPNIYYWLSFCESRWERGPQDSLPESYLKKCVMEYPKSDIAKRCYQEYSELMTFGYTGSAGTNIPPEVSAELKNMRQMIGQE